MSAPRQLILDLAGDDPPLRSLTASLRHSVTAHDLRVTLAALLREGNILLTDTTRPGSPLSIRDALATIADDRNWHAGYLVILTERGGAEYRTHAARADAA